jgi:hypothetical protein
VTIAAEKLGELLGLCLTFIHGGFLNNFSTWFTIINTSGTSNCNRFCIIRLMDEFHLFNKAAILDGGFQWYLRVFVKLVIRYSAVKNQFSANNSAV